MRDDPTVIALVTRARKGDQGAWDEIVERYAPLLWSICCRYRLSRADSDDVAQTVWLRLVENLRKLNDSAALAGWLAVTTQRECLRVVRAVRKQEGAEKPFGVDMTTGEDEAAMIERELERAERLAMLRAAFAQLPSPCRELLSLLMQDRPPPYSEISARLRMPVGGIGPNRARCLAKLRRSPYLNGYVESDGDA